MGNVVGVGFVWAILSLEIPPSVSSPFVVTEVLPLRNLSKEAKHFENESKQLSTVQQLRKFVFSSGF